MIPNKTLPSVMKHSFSKVPSVNVPRSKFDRSHRHKTTFDNGYLYPIYVDEALPGDTFNLKLTSVARLATPIVPFMDNLYMDFFFFAVPNRLLWNNWEKFMGAQDDPGDSTDYTVPVVTAPGGGWLEGSIEDLMGLPVGVQKNVNAFHHRAYNLIWNEWFRDQNLQDSLVVNKDDGPDSASDYDLRRRGKRHDYFTSCLPWPQKGDEIDLPLGDSAPITGLGKADQNWDTGPINVFETDGTGTTAYAKYKTIENGSSTSRFFIENDPNNTLFMNVRADLSSATAASINSLREAFQLQRMLERDARGGTRYTEIIRSHFGVISPDARLQRPEYLGGGSTPIQVTPIPQTGETLTGTPQGNLAAIGYHSQSGVGFSKSFVEHCTILGLVNVRADLTYQQGLNRMWSRQTKYDYYFPSLAHLGEQEVLNQEIYCDASANDDDVFGYQERWAEYRYHPSKITGALRSSAATPLDNWHLSQEFATLPTLGHEFIREDPPVERVVAVPSEPEFIFDGYFNVTCTRTLPLYSVPGLIDHF